MAQTELRDVLAALRDVDFPAEKQELVRAAETASAPGPVVAALRAIPPAEYANRDEVARSVPVRADGGTSAAQQAAQAQDRNRRRNLSQYQREVRKPPVQEELDR